MSFFRVGTHVVTVRSRRQTAELQDHARATRNRAGGYLVIPQLSPKRSPRSKCDLIRFSGRRASHEDEIERAGKSGEQKQQLLRRR